MEAEKEQDPFHSIIKLCHPTASQEAKFPNCPLARESENFADSDPDQFSSSPDPTPSNPTGIVMVSPPASSSSVHQHAEEEAVFHTPPEHHSHLSSSEDQNLDDLRVEGLRAVDAEDGADSAKKVRDFEPKAKKIRILGEEFDGNTVPVGETEVIILDGAGSGEEMPTVDLAEDSLDVISKGGIEVGTIDVLQKVGELMEQGGVKVDAVNGNHKLGKKCKPLEDVRMNKSEKPNENSDLSGSLDSGKIEDDIVNLKYIVGSRCIEGRQESGVGGSEKVVKITNAKMPNHGYGDGDVETDDKRVKEIGQKSDGKRIEEIGLKTDGKRIEEIDKFRYEGDVDGRWKGGTGRAVGDCGRRRQLPASVQGIEKNEGGRNVAETVETKGGLLDFLDILKVVVGDMDGGCEDLDFLETAKRRGLTFPKARWWPSEGDDEWCAS